MSRTVERVVVGVDGSAGSVAALRQGAQEAARHGAALCPVLAWSPPGGEAADALQPAPADVRAYWEAQARRALTKTCERALGAAPFRLRVAPRIIRAEPGPALVASARHDTDMLVLGAGSHGLWHRFLHGSVSRHCLRHARGPVMVVHPGEEDVKDARGAARPPRRHPPVVVPVGPTDPWHRSTGSGPGPGRDG
ncbi:universal stress protein [Streptomyces rectiverticillatus]|uniref:universal stress protein n=1 Tax=Streptomyces rectiverticillatus TaxID=173860 RepID=UPI0015C3D930|nr:universal stress protein [Streptomyces rectiverticillatus]QLE70555.1 universal stress protein [Streptomyces rectiverticillatus]